MLIQLALDRLTQEECMRILGEVHWNIDVIEIGTGVIKEYGMEIVRNIREAYQDKILLADMKTCDAGKYEAKQAFVAGADVMTVMGFSSDRTIIDTLEVAEQYNKQIEVDLLGIDDKQRISKLTDIGVSHLCFHIGKDLQLEYDGARTDMFDLILNVENINISIAGGINEQSLPQILKRKPHKVIIGSAITVADKPGIVAAKLKETILNYEENN